MVYGRESLRQLKEKLTRKKELEIQRETLTAQRQALVPVVQEQKERKEMAEQEVAMLESGGLTGLLFRVAGNREGRLENERAELRAAQAAYAEAAGDLASVEAGLWRTEDELRGLENCPERYEAARKAAAQAIKTAGSARADELMRTEEAIARAQRQQNGLEEAIHQTEAVLEYAKQTSRLVDDTSRSRLYSIYESDKHDAAQYRADKLVQQLTGNVEHLRALAAAVQSDLDFWQETLDQILLSEG